MIVVVLDRGDPGLRGFLTRWLLELKANCFVGDVTAEVREQIWEGIVTENQDRFIGGVMAYSTNTEQGFDFRMIGDPKRFVSDFEGIKLITYRKGDREDEQTSETIGNISDIEDVLRKLRKKRAANTKSTF